MVPALRRVVVRTASGRGELTRGLDEEVGVGRPGGDDGDTGCARRAAALRVRGDAHRRDAGLATVGAVAGDVDARADVAGGLDWHLSTIAVDPESI
jgi:hypothetical protein